MSISKETDYERVKTLLDNKPFHFIKTSYPDGIQKITIYDNKDSVEKHFGLNVAFFLFTKDGDFIQLGLWR